MHVETIKIYNTLDLSERLLPLITVQGKNPGPSLWLVATAHGNELVGIEVIHRVLDKLKATGLERGTLYAMPLLNPMANELNQRFVPTDGENLNRRFPGKPDGGFTDRLAHTIYQTILERGADVVLDLHTMGLSRTIPFIILDRPEDPTMKEPLEALAEAFGITTVYDFSPTDYVAQQLDGSLSGTMLNVARILSYTVELGPGSIILPDFVEAGTRGVLNVLGYLDMLPLEAEAQRRINHHLPLRRDFGIYANQTGIVEYLVVPGEAFSRGQALARIKNIVGEALEVIPAPHDGFVLGLAERAVSFPGISLMTIAVKEDAV
jgi:hypothetical protein